MTTKKEPICNPKSLQETIERDNAVLIDTYPKVIRHIKIKFRCNCGEESEKEIYQLIKVSSAFCKKCTRLTWTKRQKETNIKKYGVECIVHAPKIKEEIIKNNIDKYGVENIFQSTDIRKKLRKQLWKNMV